MSDSQTAGCEPAQGTRTAAGARAGLLIWPGSLTGGSACRTVVRPATWPPSRVGGDASGSARPCRQSARRSKSGSACDQTAAKQRSKSGENSADWQSNSRLNSGQTAVKQRGTCVCCNRTGNAVMLHLCCSAAAAGVLLRRCSDVAPVVRDVEAISQETDSAEQSRRR
jgi:hypothetical protein